MGRNDFNAIDFDDPQIAAALTRAYARILAWPDPPPREEYIIHLTQAQYRKATALLRGTGIVLEEMSEH
jgi:hypothetical protein